MVSTGQLHRIQFHPRTDDRIVKGVLSEEPSWRKVAHNGIRMLRHELVTCKVQHTTTATMTTGDDACRTRILFKARPLPSRGWPKIPS